MGKPAMIHIIIILLGGKGERFSKNGYAQKIPLYPPVLIPYVFFKFGFIESFPMGA